jgi:hypothetical protein
VRHPTKQASAFWREDLERPAGRTEIAELVQSSVYNFSMAAPSARWIALAKDLLQIAQQERFDDVRHDRVPVPEIEAPSRKRRVQTLTRRDASDLRQAAVDKEFGADHEAGVIGSQKGNCLGDLVQVGDAANRHLGRHVVEKALLLGNVRTGEAGPGQASSQARG